MAGKTAKAACRTGGAIGGAGAAAGNTDRAAEEIIIRLDAKPERIHGISRTEAGTLIPVFEYAVRSGGRKCSYLFCDIDYDSGGKSDCILGCRWDDELCSYITWRMVEFGETFLPGQIDLRTKAGERAAREIISRMDSIYMRVRLARLGRPKYFIFMATEYALPDMQLCARLAQYLSQVDEEDGPDAVASLLTRTGCLKAPALLRYRGGISEGEFACRRKKFGPAAQALANELNKPAGPNEKQAGASEKAAVPNKEAAAQETRGGTPEERAGKVIWQALFSREAMTEDMPEEAKKLKNMMRDERDRAAALCMLVDQVF